MLPQLVEQGLCGSRELPDHIEHGLGVLLIVIVARGITRHHEIEPCSGVFDQAHGGGFTEKLAPDHPVRAFDAREVEAPPHHFPTQLKVVLETPDRSIAVNIVHFARERQPLQGSKCRFQVAEVELWLSHATKV